MARAALRGLIPPLDDAWLAGAELSLPIAPRVERAGLSVFLPSTLEAEAFLAAIAASPSVAALEERLRGELALAPRRWFKLACERGRRVAVQQYLQIDPRIGYPITTIRRFLRNVGAESPPTLEPALAAELDVPSFVGGFVARHDASALVPSRAKLWLAVPPSRVGPLVTRLFDSDVGAASAHAAGLGAPGANVFVSFTPGLAASVQIDVTAPRPADLPCPFDGLGVGWSSTQPLAYAKWRASDPIWTAYVPLDAYEVAHGAFSRA